MSWLATKYAWKCQHARVKGSVRLVLLAIALRVKKSYVSTTPTSLGVLRRLTLLSEDQIRRCLDILTSTEVGEVRRVRRGKRATYAMSTMVGPLFVCDAEESGKMQDFLWTPPAPKTLQDAGKKPGILQEKNPASCRVSPVRTASFRDVVRTKERTTTTTAGAAAEVLAFLEWWTTAYALYNHGAHTNIDLEDDATIVAELLDRRTFARLQLMAIVLWRITARESQWIADSDRGLRVLRHKADWLDQYVSRLPAWWQDCPHAPKCVDVRDCDAKPREAVG